ncbi:MAG: hypothetical protein Q8P35_02135 [Candidatus Yanofskybacteria bacterium]|nr:hypothetical protein [Candidatus Yanofskybacteria bacterium]
MKQSVVKILTKKSYLAMIRNAAKGDNHMFRNMFGEENGQEKDLTKNGALSCGKVASAILYLNKLIKDLHLTVESTERDMLASGWREISELKESAVIVWESRPGDDGAPHLHMGFYLGNDEAMSNDSNGTGMPIIHHVTDKWDPPRKIMRIYWHPTLDEA